MPTHPAAANGTIESTAQSRGVVHALRGAATTLACVAWLAAWPTAHAASLRCPGATIAGVANATEANEITALWTALGDGAGSDGPLGCPTAPATIASDAGWNGIAQPFQRGVILIGRGPSAGSEIVTIRGLYGWTVWWTGMGAFLDATDTAPMLPDNRHAPNASAAWLRGGTVQVLWPTASNNVALWACHPVANVPCAESHEATGRPDKSNWERVTPWMTAAGRPFDAAARLNEDGLAVPDPAKRAARVAALLPDWLSCYTNIPIDDPQPGEDTFARVAVMMRRSAPCPLTGVSPRAAANQWLATLSFPDDQYPGTGTDDFPCGRKGELDIAIVQLMRIVLRHHSELDAATVDHVRDILQKWGGRPRADPYVTPNGSCLGFGVIETENHILLQETGRYLINMLLAPRGLGAKYDNSANADWLVFFMQQIARRDFYEFNALAYTRYQAKALYALHDHADTRVATAARGLLDWLFAKAAIFGDLDRDHRTFRRRPEAERYGQSPWWGKAMTATTAQAAVIAGSLQHVHEDIDLQYNGGRDDDGKQALTDLADYPDLGAAGEDFLAEIVDVSDSDYVLPSALSDWLARRFTDDGANRLTYVQAIRHASSIKDDKSLFAQANDGVELVSGNRNWTIVAGGVPVGPGDPGPPPQSTGSEIGFGAGGVVGGAVAGAAVGGAVAGGWGAAAGSVVGAVAGFFGAEKKPADIAAEKQHDKLWSDQIAVLRETALIPTPIGLNRAQTLRFGAPELTSEGLPQWARLCVADGFMCGFDLHLPVRPFAAKDVADCPLKAALPGALDAYAQGKVGANGATLASLLRCLVKNPGQQDEWQIFSYEFGTLAIADGDPPGSERVMLSWIETPSPGQRILHLQWKLPGQQHDWYNAHMYDHAVAPASGDAPGDSVTFQTYGDPDHRDTWDGGDLTFDLAGVPDATWDILVEACDPTYGFLGVRTGHQCNANVLPDISVTVAPEPKQAFSCNATSDSQTGSQAIVMEVGSCKEGPYGLFVYIFNQACPRQRGSGCPVGASDYGFAVVAPSRGWTMDAFRGAVDAAILNYQSAAGHAYRPSVDTATLEIPMSPAVEKDVASNTWKPIPGAVSPTHVVTFRWPAGSQTSIVSDTAHPGLYGAIGGATTTWPRAFGAVSLPDAFGAGALATFIRGTDVGCITIPGLATASNPDPKALVIDLRDAAAPRIDEPPNSTLGASCT